MMMIAIQHTKDALGLYSGLQQSKFFDPLKTGQPDKKGINNLKKRISSYRGSKIKVK